MLVHTHTNYKMQFSKQTGAEKLPMNEEEMINLLKLFIGQKFLFER